MLSLVPCRMTAVVRICFATADHALLRCFARVLGGGAAHGPADDEEEEGDSAGCTCFGGRRDSVDASPQRASEPSLARTVSRDYWRSTRDSADPAHVYAPNYTPLGHKADGTPERAELVYHVQEG